MSDPYSEIAEYYDQEHRHFADDVEMYLQFVEAAGDPVLELACGTGRVLLPIARAGFRVLGIDSSEPMLQRARTGIEAGKFNSLASVTSGDISKTRAPDAGTYGVAILALDSLLHFTSQDAQLAVLRNALEALDPRGQLIIDMFHPTPARLHTLDGSLELAATWETPQGEHVDKTISRVAYPSEQLIRTELWYDRIDRSGAVHRTRTGFAQRWIYPGELLLMLKTVGFQDWRFYGSYELDPLTDNSDRLIVAAEVTKTG